MWKGSIKLGYAKKVCYFPRFTNEILRGGGGLIKIKWLVAYTWVKKLSRPQNKPDKHN